MKNLFAVAFALVLVAAPVFATDNSADQAATPMPASAANDTTANDTTN